MTLSIVQASGTSLATAGGVLSLVLPAAPTAGNRLVFFVATSGVPWSAVPANTVLDVEVADGTNKVDALYSRPVVAADGTTYAFTPTGTTATSRGVAFEVASSVGAVTLDVAATAPAATDVTRTVTLPAGSLSGEHLVFGEVGLGGTSGGADAVSSPFTSLAPTPFDSGRMHVGRYFVTGTTFANPTFTWTTSRRCIALAAAYGEVASSVATTVTASWWTGTAAVPLEIQLPKP